LTRYPCQNIAVFSNSQGTLARNEFDWGLGFGIGQGTLAKLLLDLQSVKVPLPEINQIGVEDVKLTKVPLPKYCWLFKVPRCPCQNIAGSSKCQGTLARILLFFQIVKVPLPEMNLIGV
jgi:hypothetical protein